MPNQYTLGLVSRRPPIDRFWPKVRVQPNGCWLWNGYLNNKGYGKISVNCKPAYAHRFAYERFWGLIPEDKELDHLCRNHACVNPFHLEVVTTQVNCLRGNSPASIAHRKARERPHCIHGHPWTSENTYCRKSGQKSCRTCHREQERIAKRRRNGQNP